MHLVHLGCVVKQGNGIDYRIIVLGFEFLLLHCKWDVHWIGVLKC